MEIMYLQLFWLLILSYFQHFVQTEVDVCDWDIYDCDYPYDIEVSESFKCNPNDCPVNFKCCSHRCFRHNICQPSKELEPQQLFNSGVSKPGECDILLSCDIDLPNRFIKQFECQQDDDCPDHFKCCYIDCYKVKVCQPAINENIINDYVTEMYTSSSIAYTERPTTTRPPQSTQRTTTTTLIAPTEKTTSTERPLKTIQKTVNTERNYLDDDVSLENSGTRMKMSTDYVTQYITKTEPTTSVTKTVTKTESSAKKTTTSIFDWKLGWD